MHPTASRVSPIARRPNFVLWHGAMARFPGFKPLRSMEHNDQGARAPWSQNSL